MRKLLPILIFLCASSFANATITIVDNDSNHGHIKCQAGSSSQCTTGDIDTSGATLYVAIILTTFQSTTASSPMTIISTNTNNGTSFDLFTCLTKYQNSKYSSIQICYMPQPTPGPYTTFHVSTGGSSGYPTLLVSVWKGTQPDITAIDTGAATGTSTAASVNSLATGSTGTLSGTGELVISGWTTTGAGGAGNITSLAASGLAVLDTNLTSGSAPAGDAYAVESSTTAVNSTWSVTGTAEDMAVAIAAFKPASGTPISIYNFTSGVSAPANPYASIIANPITEVTGNLMVCGVGAFNSGGATAYPTSVSDANNSYVDSGVHLDFSGTSNDYKMSIWYAKNLTGGTGLTPTTTWGTATYYGFIICHQYVNMNTSAPFDSTANATGTNLAAGLSVTSGALTTTLANDVIFSFSMTDVWAVQTFTPGTNFTLRGLDYTALQAGPGRPTTPYTDIWQASAIQDWIPNAIETGVTSSISYNHASNSGMVVAAFKGLGGTPVRLRGSVAQ